MSMSISSSSHTISTHVHFHRRSSVPSVVGSITTSGIAASSGGSSSSLARERRVQSLPSHSLPTGIHILPAPSFPPLPAPPSRQKVSSSNSSIAYSSRIPTPNNDCYTIPNDSPVNSSTVTKPIPALQSPSHFLKLPPLSKTRGRSNSEPVNPVLLHEIPNDRTISALTSSSSSSSSDVIISDIRKYSTNHLIEPKENKHEERRLSRSREKFLFCFKEMQLAEEYIKTKKPEDYVQKAIILYRQVIKSENMGTTPWVEPYFRLVDLLSETDPNNNKEIIGIFDSVVGGHFDVWEKVDALMRKAQLFKESHDYSNIGIALDCWEQAKVLVQDQTSAAEKIRKETYLKCIRLSISKIMKKKKAVDQYTTTA